MRIKLVLESEENNQISLPVHYNQIIQGFLYHNLPTELRKFLHDVGFFYHNKPFKLFTFSKIFSKKITINNSMAYFESPIIIFISSAVEDVSKSFAKSLLTSEKIFLKNQSLTLKSIEILQKPKFDFINKIKTLSPITMYKTIEKEDGKKITQYFFSEDPELRIWLKKTSEKNTAL
jgi:CRISPR-associated endoribonuclease Cas6